MNECKCNIRPEMGVGGAAALLCHHSALEEIEAVQVQLIDVLNSLSANIDPEQMLSKPLQEVAEGYIRDIVGRDYNMLTAMEHNVLLAAFLRHASLGLQALQTSVIERTQTQAGTRK